MKTILLFIVGLVVWLLLTNYQVVYSKLISFTNQESENVEKINIVEDVNDEEIAQDTNNITTENEIAEADLEVTDEEDSASLEEEQLAETDETFVEANIEENVSETSEATSEPELIEVAAADNAVENAEAELEEEFESEAEAAIDQAVQSQVASNFPMYNPAMMSAWTPYMNNNVYNSWANPFTNMMMAMMGSMMNPATYMNPMTMMNPSVSIMTQPQHLSAMMQTMDPNMMFGMFGQPSQSYKDGETPDQLPVITIPGFPTQTYENWPKNTVSPEISREAKHNTFKTAMALSPLSMRNMVSMMADKIPVEEGVSWDDAVEAMKLRANEVNFKFVGSSPLWKQIEAETEQPSAKVEMFRFCDARMARKILDEVPEFIIFLPCKIALLEDAEGKLWVMTLDWDVSWLDYAQNPNSHLSKDIREHAKLIRDNIQYIMEGAATGDF